MNATYSVPSGATATDGSHDGPADPLTSRGAEKRRPPSVDRAKPIPPQPIHAAYTSRGSASADTTSAFCPRQPRLSSVTGISPAAAPPGPAPERPGPAAGTAGPGGPARTSTRITARTAASISPARLQKNLRGLRGERRSAVTVGPSGAVGGSLLPLAVVCLPAGSALGAGSGIAGGDRGVLGAVAIPVPVAPGKRDALGQGPVERGPQPAHGPALRGGRDIVAVPARPRRGQGRQVGPGREHGPAVLRHRAGDLDVLAARQLPDDAGLDAVLEQFAVLALEAKADPLGGPVGDDGRHEDRDPRDPGGRVQRDVEVVGDDVVPALEPQDAVEGDRRHP